MLILVLSGTCRPMHTIFCITAPCPYIILKNKFVPISMIITSINRYYKVEIKVMNELKKY